MAFEHLARIHQARGETAAVRNGACITARKVGARGKAAARTRHQQHARGAVIAHGIDRVDHLAHRFRAESVQHLGPVDRQRRDAVLFFEQDVFVGHAHLPVCSSGRCLAASGDKGTGHLKGGRSPDRLPPRA